MMFEILVFLPNRVAQLLDRPQDLILAHLALVELHFHVLLLVRGAHLLNPRQHIFDPFQAHRAG